MAVTDPDAPPDFYKRYVSDVQHRIAENAAMEFERLWIMHKEKNMMLSIASDELSLHVTKLKDAIQDSSLYEEDEKLRLQVSNLNTPIHQFVQVLRKTVPETLQELVSIEELVKRLPESYLKAVFSAYIASRFVYTSTTGSAELGLHQYLLALREGRA